MKPKIVQCVLGILVLIVGIYIIIKIIQFCQEHFPNPSSPPAPPPPTIPTNGQVTSAYFVVGDTPQATAEAGLSRALLVPATSSCDCGCNFVLRIGITNGVPIILGARNPDLIGAAQFMQQFTALGFNEYRSSNNAPGVIGYAGGQVTVQGDGMVNVTIESSPDMRDWSEQFSTAFPAAMQVDLNLPGQPCTNNVFYRIKSE